jgi:hypothetical protein
MAMAGMYSAEYIDGPHVVILAQNAHELETGVPISFNIRLYDQQGQPIPFSSIEATIKQNGLGIYRQNFPQSENGDVTLTTTFDTVGAHMLFVSFFDNDKHIAKGEFPLSIKQGASKNIMQTVFSFPVVVAFMLGAGTALLARRYKSLLLRKLPKRLFKKRN